MIHPYLYPMLKILSGWWCPFTRANNYNAMYVMTIMLNSRIVTDWMTGETGATIRMVGNQRQQYNTEVLNQCLPHNIFCIYIVQQCS